MSLRETPSIRAASAWIFEDAAGHETHGHEKSNDDRRTLYLGSQRSRSTTLGW